MCYYSLSRIAHKGHVKGVVVSALVNFINDRMRQLGRSQSQISDAAGLRRGVLSNILTKEEKGGKPVRPEPETIRKLAVGLEVHPALLTALMGYPTEPMPDIDERVYALAQQLLGAPWLAERIPDFFKLPRDEFDELMRYLEYRRHPPQNGDRSIP